MHLPLVDFSLNTYCRVSYSVADVIERQISEGTTMATRRDGKPGAGGGRLEKVVIASCLLCPFHILDKKIIS